AAYELTYCGNANFTPSSLSGLSGRWSCGPSCRRALKMFSYGMAQSYPTLIPGLRSPFDQVKGIVYFGRMLDKIKLQAAGKLPEGWQPMRGTTVKGTFDGRCCNFLHIDYADLEAETLKGGSDEELLAWAFANGRQPRE